MIADRLGAEAARCCNLYPLSQGGRRKVRYSFLTTGLRSCLFHRTLTL